MSISLQIDITLTLFQELSLTEQAIALKKMASALRITNHTILESHKKSTMAHNDLTLLIGYYSDTLKLYSDCLDSFCNNLVQSKCIDDKSIFDGSKCKI